MSWMTPSGAVAVDGTIVSIYRLLSSSLLSLLKIPAKLDPPKLRTNLQIQNMRQINRGTTFLILHSTGIDHAAE
eukprot:scaffold9482_cov23-Cyclotella_meneghiniana.AAC.1